jgi:BirA family biotin operon repressor/biotin-[acetyl-CoA-carboxylase] ligase
MRTKLEQFDIIELESVDSTHIYIQNYISKNKYKSPLCVITHNQTNGIGSRDNKWIGYKNNIFFSFVIHKDQLPCDLPIQSASIYFNYLLIEILRKYNSTVWLKWPNDFYINDFKIGGTITHYKQNLFYCGIGLNLVQNEQFKSLDIKFDYKKHLGEFFKLLGSKPTWKQIFSKFLIEFDKSRKFFTTIDKEKISLKNAILKDDGSIDINNKKVFSLR